MTAPFRVRSLGLDLPAVAGAFNRRLHDAGVAVTAERAAWFAQALATVEPVSRRRLYWTARAVFVSDPAQVRAFDAVFGSVFGSGRVSEGPDGETVFAAADDRPASDRPRAAPDLGRALREHGLGAASPRARRDSPREERVEEVPVPVLASDEELLRSKRFDALEPDELVRLYRLMARLRVATPLRRTRRARRDRRGERIDMRRTLRGSLRTAGDPIRLARRRRRIVRGGW